MSKLPVLHYQIQGAGPTVVLLHGYLASSQYWRKVADTLAIDHRVVAIDLLGFGKSPKPSCSRYDYAAQIASIERTLEKADVRQPFDLIGHSMGSLIALRYTRLHQQQIHKLVLANMPILLTKQQAKREILGTNVMYRLGLQPSLHWLIWPLFRLATYSRLIIPTVSGENAVIQRAYMFQSSAVSRLRSLRNVIFAATIEADLAAIPTPTVLLSGLQDRAQYIENVARLQLREHIKAVNVFGGHHLPLSNPKLFANYLR